MKCTYEEDKAYFSLKKAPPMAMCGMRVLQLLLQGNGITVRIDNLAMSRAGKGIIMRDENNFKLKFDDKIATIGRRGVLYTLLPCDFEQLGLKEGETLGIVGDVPTENATLHCEHHFLVTQDREDEKQWDVVGMVNSNGETTVIGHEETEKEFMRISKEFMEKRKERKEIKKQTLICSKKDKREKRTEEPLKLPFLNSSAVGNYGSVGFFPFSTERPPEINREKGQTCSTNREDTNSNCSVPIEVLGAPLPPFSSFPFGEPSG